LLSNAQVGVIKSNYPGKVVKIR